jgi:hypothetical protein
MDNNQRYQGSQNKIKGMITRHQTLEDEESTIKKYQ